MHQTVKKLVFITIIEVAFTMPLANADEIWLCGRLKPNQESLKSWVLKIQGKKVFNFLWNGFDGSPDYFKIIRNDKITLIGIQTNTDGLENHQNHELHRKDYFGYFTLIKKSGKWTLRKQSLSDGYEDYETGYCTQKQTIQN